MRRRLADRLAENGHEATLLGATVEALPFPAGSFDAVVSALGDVGWIVAVAVVATLIGKIGAGVIAGRLGGFTSRQGFNAGIALVAHGEFTIILAQIASGNSSIDAGARTDLVAFAGLYVLVTATIGVVLMKESKRLGRILFPIRRLAPET